MKFIVFFWFFSQTGVAVNVSLLCNDDDVEIQEEYQDDFEEDDEDVEEGMCSFRRKINVNLTQNELFCLHYVM